MAECMHMATQSQACPKGLAFVQGLPRSYLMHHSHPCNMHAHVPCTTYVLKAVP